MPNCVTPICICKVSAVAPRWCRARPARRISACICARRAPIADWSLLGNPLRYVLEGAHTEFLGEQRGALGFTGLTSLGVGLELDSSKYPVFITRTRLVARYMFGNNTTGYGVGLAKSF